MVTGLIFTYLFIPVGIGIVLGFFGSPEKWKPTTMIGAGVLLVGQNLLKLNSSVPIETSMKSVGLVMALGALLLGRGVVMVVRQQRLEKNKNDKL